MKNSLLLVILLHVHMLIYSQLTWNFTDEPATQTHHDYFLIDSNVTNYPQIKGANSTWDYSNIFTYSRDNLKRVETNVASASPFVNFYGTANNFTSYVNKFQSFATIWSTQKDDFGLVFYEDGFGDIVLFYDAHKSRTYPWSYQSSIQGNYSNAWIAVNPNTPSELRFPTVGAYTVECDGTGKIIIGDSTIDGVMRTYSYDSAQADLNIFGIGTFIRRQYEYHLPGNPYPLFFHSYVDIISPFVIINFSMVISQVEPKFALGVHEQPRNVVLKMYPNPTSNEVNLSFEKPQNIQHILIYNALGEEVERFENLGWKEEITLEISDLNVGVYSLQVISNDGNATAKLIKSN